MNSIWNAISEAFGENGPFWTLVLALFAGLFSFVFRGVRDRVYRFGRKIAEMWHAVSVLARVNGAVEGSGVWLHRNPKPPAGYHDFYLNPLPILTVANLKGGVGKTTVAANLGAYFATEHNERVLFIDLDYQGSLSSMLVKHEGLFPGPGSNSAASELVTGEIQLRQFSNFAAGVDRLPTSRVIKAYYDLARAETKVLVHWLTGRFSRDARYNLAEILHSATVRESFDRIIIDAPPRLTASSIQAFAASTHVLIPTILDRLSGDAVASFVDQLVVHKSIWPALKIVGVAPQLTSNDVGRRMEENPDADPQSFLIVSERNGLAAVEGALRRIQAEHKMPNLPTRVLPYDTFIQKRAEIAECAGRTMAMLDISNESRAMFRRLGSEIKLRMEPSNL